jgi:hypothetical protein
MSGEIVALVVPVTDGSMLKVNVPGAWETVHVFITVPLTPPAGIVAMIAPPPACDQLMVNVMDCLFVYKPPGAFIYEDWGIWVVFVSKATDAPVPEPPVLKFNV